MVKEPKDWLNLHGSIFVIFFDHSEKKFNSKKCFLVKSEILRPFLNLLTSDQKYSLSVKPSV